MLKYYDLNKTLIGGLKNCKDLKVESELSSGDKQLSFLWHINNKIKMCLECYIRTDTDEFVIKENSKGSNGYRKIVANLNLEDLEGKAMEKFEAVEHTVKECADMALSGTGWRCICTMDKRRGMKLTKVTALDVLNTICKAFLVEVRFDTINKMVYFQEEIGDDRGVYFTKSLNLKEVIDSTDTYDYFTQILPIGKDGLKIDGINGGKAYLENYQYSSKKKMLIWEDSRYETAEALKEDAQKKLAEISKSKKSYQSKVIDLSKQSEKYSVLSYSLGDAVTLIENETDLFEKQRIVKITEYLNDPTKNTCELSNATLTFEEMQSRLFEAADIVNNITEDNGTVKVYATDIKGLEDYLNGNQKIKDLTTQYLYVSGELGALKASFGEMQTTYLKATDAEITYLKVEKAEADYLKIDVAEANYIKTNVFEALDATVKKINGDFLTFKSGEFETLKSKQASFEEATAQKFTAANGNIDNLTGQFATFKELTTTNFTAITGSIKDLEVESQRVKTLLAGNITAENIATGAITAGSGIIANGAIGDAEISNLSANKIKSGTVDTSLVTIASKDSAITITGNQMMINDTTNAASPINRVILGKYTSGSTTTYGLLIRGKDGKTVMLDGDGVHNAGITNGAIDNNKVADDANISGNKLDINSVVRSVNGATEKIQSTVVQVGDRSLNVYLGEQTNTIASNYTALQGYANTKADDALKDAKSYADGVVEGVSIGGRNLLLDSGHVIENSKFLMIRYKTSYLKPNTKYTFVINGNTNTGNKFAIFFNNGEQPGAYFRSASEVTTQYITVQTPDTLTDTMVNVYNHPYSTATNATLNWACMYEGDIKPPLDWSPAPEDTQAQFEAVMTSLTEQSQKLLEQTGIINSQGQLLAGHTATIQTQSETLKSHEASIKANQDSIKLKVDTQTYTSDKTAINTSISDNLKDAKSYADTKKTEAISAAGTDAKAKADKALADSKTFTNAEITKVNTSLSKATADITVLQGQITSKVEQTDIDKSVDTVKLYVDGEVGKAIEDTTESIKTAKSEIKQTTDAITQNVSNLQTTVSTHTTQIGNKAETSTVTAISNRTASLETKLTGITGKVTDYVSTTVTDSTKDLVTGLETVNGSIETINSKQAGFELTLSGFATDVSNLEKTVEKKADGSALSTLSSTVSNLSSNLDGFKTSVSSTYTTKTELSNTLGSYSTTTQMNGAIEATKTAIAADVLKDAKSYADGAINNLEVSAKNLARGTTGELRGYTPTTGTNSTFDYANVYTSGLKVGDTVTLAIDVEYTNRGSASGQTHGIRFQGAAQPGSVWTTNPFTGCIGDFTSKLVGTSGTIHLTGKAVMTAEHLEYEYFNFGVRSYYSNGTATYKFKNLMVVRGEKEMDWMPAPEDIQAQFEATTTSYSTTTQMNSAIEATKTAITSTVSETYSTKAELTTATGKITALETWKQEASQKITKDGIVSTVGSYYAKDTDLTAAENRITAAESTISQHAKEIALKVTENGVSSLIQQWYNGITIQAQKINLNGVVTANNNFKILADGSMEAKNGKFVGDVTATSGKIAGFKISGNRMYAEKTTGANTFESFVIDPDAKGESSSDALFAVKSTFFGLPEFAVTKDDVQMRKLLVSQISPNPAGTILFLNGAMNVSGDILKNGTPLNNIYWTANANAGTMYANNWYYLFTDGLTLPAGKYLITANIVDDFTELQVWDDTAGGFIFHSVSTHSITIAIELDRQRRINIKGNAAKNLNMVVSKRYNLLQAIRLE